MILKIINSVVLQEGEFRPPNLFASDSDSDDDEDKGPHDQVDATFNILNLFVILQCLEIPDRDQRLAIGLQWRQPKAVSPILAQVTYFVRLGPFLKVHQIKRAFRKRVDYASISWVAFTDWDHTGG